MTTNNINTTKRERMERLERLLERCREKNDSMVKEKSMKRLVREINTLDRNNVENDLLCEGANAIHLWVEGSLRVLIDKYRDVDISVYTSKLQGLIDKLYMLIEELPPSENYYRPHVVYAIGTCEFFLFQLRMKYDICFEKSIFLTSLRVCLGNLRQELNDDGSTRTFPEMRYLYARDFIDPETFEMFEKSIKPGKGHQGGVTIRKRD